MDSGIGLRERFIYGSLGTELSRLEVPRVKIGGISSLDLGGAQGSMGFPMQELVGFSGTFRGSWVFLLRNCWLLFRLFT